MTEPRSGRGRRGASEPRLVLIDASVWIEAIHARGLPGCREAVEQVLREGTGATCEVIIAEVLKGAATPAALGALSDGLSPLRLLGMEGVGLTAGVLAQRLRSRGRAIPTTDLLIAATCALHGASLLHRDQHLAVAAEALGVTQHPIP
jgi:predicted nucleic acid-binding protein